MGALVTAALFSVCVVGHAADQTTQKPWVQKGFVLSTFNVLNSDTTKYKQALTLTKESGIDLVELTFLSRDDLNVAIKVAEGVGVKVLAQDLASFSGRGNEKGERRPLTEESIIKEIGLLKKSKALAGYYLWDEPNAKDFIALRKLRDISMKQDPGRLAFSVIFPSYGDYKWKDNSYPKYVDDYLKIVDPDVVSFDYYPFVSSDSLIGNDIWRDFGYIRRKSLELNKPLWFYFQAIQFKPAHVAVTLERVRAQMYAALTYGSKGLSYYYENKKGLLLDASFGPSTMYGDLKQLNSEVKNIGKVLYPKRSEKIYQTTDNAEAVRGPFFLDKLEDSDLVKSAPKDLAIGVFGDSSPEKYLMITNLNHAVAAVGHVKLARPMNVSAYDKKSDTKKRMSKPTDVLDVNLLAGEAVLYLLK